MMTQVIIGSFDDVDEADRAYRDLLAAGFPHTDLNLVISNARSRSGDRGIFESETVEAGSTTTRGAVAGGVLGGAAGLAAGLMGLTLPGIGAIAGIGAIIATLAGASAGAVAGGLLGSLTDMGVHRADAELYAESVRRGGSLVTARADIGKAEDATAIMRRHGAIDIAARAEEWRATGWTGHDPSAEPMSDGEVEQDRVAVERRAEAKRAGADALTEVTSDGAWPASDANRSRD